MVRSRWPLRASSLIYAFGDKRLRSRGQTCTKRLASHFSTVRMVLISLVNLGCVGIALAKRALVSGTHANDMGGLRGRFGQVAVATSQLNAQPNLAALVPNLFKLVILPVYRSLDDLRSIFTNGWLNLRRGAQLTN